MLAACFEYLKPTQLLVLSCLSLDMHALPFATAAAECYPSTPERTLNLHRLGAQELKPCSRTRHFGSESFLDVLPGLLDPVSSDNGEMGTSVL